MTRPQAQQVAQVFDSSWAIRTAQAALTDLLRAQAAVLDAVGGDPSTLQLVTARCELLRQMAALACANALCAEVYLADPHGSTGAPL
jgi:hypothetical protein